MTSNYGATSQSSLRQSRTYGMCTPRMCILQWESRSNLPALPNCPSQLTPSSKHISREDLNGGEFRLISLQTIPRPRSPNDFNPHKLLVCRLSSLMVAKCHGSRRIRTNLLLSRGSNNLSFQLFKLYFKIHYDQRLFIV